MGLTGWELRRHPSDGYPARRLLKTRRGMGAKPAVW
jgi:hypothetical protein